MVANIVDTIFDVVDPNDGKTSLREALARAQNGSAASTIEFSASLLAPNHTSGDRVILQLNSALVVGGPSPFIDIEGDIDFDGIADIKIDAQGTSRHFTIAEGGQLALSDIDLTGGHDAGADGADGQYVTGDYEGTIVHAPNGGDGSSAAGSIYNAGSLVLNNVTISNSSAIGGNGGMGGGSGSDVPSSSSGRGGNGAEAAIVLNLGIATLENVTLQSNSVTGGAGGVGGLAQAATHFGGGGSGSNGAILINHGTLGADSTQIFGSAIAAGGGGATAPQFEGYGPDGSSAHLINSGQAYLTYAEFGGAGISGPLAINSGTLSGEITAWGNGASIVGDGRDVNGGNYSIQDIGSGSNTATVSVRIVEFATDTISVNEGNGGFTTITATLTRSLYDQAGSVTVNPIEYYYWNEYPDVSAGVDAQDFEGGVFPGSQVISFAAGQQTATISFNIVGDYDLESDEHFYLGLNNPVRMDVGTQGPNFAYWQDLIRINVLNDDTQLSIAQETSSAPEGTPLTFTITRTGYLANEQTVDYAVTGSGLSQASASDFTGGAFPSGTITFEAGVASMTLTVNIQQDSNIEADETFTVTLSNASEHGTIVTSAVTGTIVNDDSTYTVTPVKSSLDEGNAGTTTFQVQVFRQGATAVAQTLDWAVTAGTADATDFPGGVLPLGQVTFAAGQSMATVDILVAGDETPEANETFAVTFSNVGTQVAPPLTLTILDDDTIHGVETGAVAEDGIQSANGVLAVDPSHTGATQFQPVTALASTYGAFTFNETTGVWTYTLNNNAANVQALTAGQTVQDSITVTTFDGIESEPVTVTITGTNDVALISGTATGAVGEDGTVTTGGTLTISDADAGQSKFQTTTALSGLYGSFSFNAANGVWGYALNNGTPVVQSLTGGQVVHDTITVKSSDGTANQMIDVTITGTNDIAVITGSAVGAVTEDGTLATGGKLTVTDVDTGEAKFQTPANVNGTYGVFTLNSANGSWTYALSNSAGGVQALDGGQVVHDTLIVKSFDGTAQQTLDVTITGTNEPAKISGAAVGSVAEDGTLTAGGTLTVTDPDSGQSVFLEPDNLTGAYGWFAFNAQTGVWGYSLDNGQLAVQALAGGQVVHDTLTVTSFDGTASQTIDVAIAGNNDAPSAVLLTTAVSSIVENTAVPAPIKVADIAVTDIDGGINTLALTGTDASYFEIDGNALFLKAGVILDFETKSSYVVAVIADDGSDPSSDTTSAAFTLAVENVTPEALTGTSGADVLMGGSDIDQIFGLAGNDSLYGMAGDDRLIGGLGSDVMSGGAGNDVFVFNTAKETSKTGSTSDLITDFVHLRDEIDLSGIDANGSASGNAAFKFLAKEDAEFTGVKGQLHWFEINEKGTSRDRTVIEGDLNGDAKADFSITLSGLVTLSAQDFVL